MDDFLNFLKPKTNYPFTGTYYARRPQTTADVGLRFRYRKLDAKRKAYGQVIQNILENDESNAIETVSDIAFKIKGYVVLQDGTMWQITEAERHEENEITNFTFRDDINDKTVLRLTGVENPEELGENGL